MKILVIEDDWVSRAILVKVLGQLGFDTLHASDAETAWEMLESGVLPTAILVDWMMPRVSGIEFVRKLRALPAWERLPVVMVTANHRDDQIEAAKAAGVNGYLTKPFSREDIESQFRVLGLL